jgi:hypothetical protein
MQSLSFRCRVTLSNIYKLVLFSIVKLSNKSDLCLIFYILKSKASQSLQLFLTSIANIDINIENLEYMYINKQNIINFMN